jgi:hypothetical protein
MRIGGYLRRGGHTSGSGFNKEGRFVVARGGPPTLAPRFFDGHGFRVRCLH